MKKLLLLIICSLPFGVHGGVFDCGIVDIVQVIAGPRHGSMMLVSNASCGTSGWVCLDPDAEHMSNAVSDRLFSFVLANKMAGRKIAVHAYTDVYSSTCGAYPVVQDVRTVN